MHAGDMFVVKDGCYLPLFENNKEIRSFERGKKGCNCDDWERHRGTRVQRERHGGSNMRNSGKSET